MPYYNPPRQRNLFRKGEPFSFSRSKVDLFVKCPRCFYIDRVHGIDHPPGFPFTINSAVDSLLKKEFDGYRTAGTLHPVVAEAGYDLIPLAHADMDEWRENFKGLRAPYDNYEFSGAVDDIWINKAGELVVVDYKSTAAAEPVKSFDKDYHAGYKRQIEFYQWLLRKKGFNVSNLALFLCCTGDSSAADFSANIKFHMHLIPHEGTTGWIEPLLDKMIACLESDNIPPSGTECDQCRYFRARTNVGEERREERGKS